MVDTAMTNEQPSSSPVAGGQQSLPDVPVDTTLSTDPSSDLASLYKSKKEWVKQMRLQFSIRPEFEITQNIIHSDGTLNQDYFRPPKDAPRPGQEPVRKWTERERALLIEGIGLYGIGHFREISEKLLPAWSVNDLRIKCIRLIGRQNLQLYRDWKGTEEDIQREYQRNKDIGLRFSMWKGSCLVYDDDGHVLKAILATEPSATTGENGKDASAIAE
ncbi:hypothetical protein IWQ62_002672 [Dispira parvispora]|uniref:Myb-like domain-containing protein n=1 Tax=Dispira parvispora TaxID=1520584 RepID=A0A9W8E2F4_9FUNG|nr:hypothetical protein IWQ62_002672 [Dispira parvispora]